MGNLEVEIDKLLEQLVEDCHGIVMEQFLSVIDKNPAFDRTKAALLKTVDRYVEERENELAKAILRQADYMVKGGELVHAVTTNDIKDVVPSLTALRQQVKGGES